MLKNNILLIPLFLLAQTPTIFAVVYDNGIVVTENPLQSVLKSSRPRTIPPPQASPLPPPPSTPYPGTIPQPPRELHAKRKGYLNLIKMVKKFQPAVAHGLPATPTPGPGRHGTERSDLGPSTPTPGPGRPGTERPDPTNQIKKSPRRNLRKSSPTRK